jgi:hypothetical protein
MFPIGYLLQFAQTALLMHSTRDFHQPSGIVLEKGIAESVFPLNHGSLTLPIRLLENSHLRTPLKAKCPRHTSGWLVSTPETESKSPSPPTFQRGTAHEMLHVSLISNSPTASPMIFSSWTGSTNRKRQLMPPVLDFKLISVRGMQLTVGPLHQMHLIPGLACRYANMPYQLINISQTCQWPPHLLLG